MLVDPDLEKRGAALIERSDALRRAAKLDATATQNQEQADELKAKRDKAIEDQNDSRAVKEREVEEARTAAEERKGAAAEAAEKRTAAAKQQADDVAAQLTTSAEAAKRDQQATIRGPSRKPARLPSPSLTMLRQNAATLPASAHRRTRSRNWPTSRSRNANLSGRTMSDNRS